MKKRVLDELVRRAKACLDPDVARVVISNYKKTYASDRQTQKTKTTQHNGVLRLQLKAT